MSKAVNTGYDLKSGIPQSLYICDTDNSSIVSVNFVNRGSTETSVDLALTSSENTISSNEYLYKDISLAPNSAVTKEVVVVGSQQYITAYTPGQDVNAIVWGIASGKDITVSSISTNV